MRGTMRATGVLALLVAGSALAVAGTINPTSAERYQEVDAIIGSSENPSFDNDSDVVFDYDAYSKNINANASLGAVGVDPTNSSSSTQVSDIQDETIFGTGLAGVTADQSHIFGVAAAATNTFEVTFDILSPVGYSFTGSVEENASGFVQTLSANVTLTGPGGDIVNTTSTSGVTPFNSVGILAAGTYTLTADATVLTNGVGSSGGAGYDFVLLVPEPASLGLLAMGLLLIRRR